MKMVLIIMIISYVFLYYNKKAYFKTQIDDMYGIRKEDTLDY